jgi:hypothetical protein
LKKGGKQNARKIKSNPPGGRLDTGKRRLDKGI